MSYRIYTNELAYMSLDAKRKTILIAPLNWGLGHATRCIPIINALQQNNYIPIIASDGIALDLLRKEFPTIKTLELPSYNINYPKNGKLLKWKLFLNSPQMLLAVWQERKIVTKWISEFGIDGIISDNRFGVYSNKIPSVYITHQLHVLSGITSWITSKIHQQIIRKFMECWVPDFESNPNLSGYLGHLEKTDLCLKYIGPLSRMNKKEIPKVYDLMIVLSGPEPQRGILEQQLKKEILNYKGKVVFIEGIIEAHQKIEHAKNSTYYNFMTSKQLEKTYNESCKVLCRSGYTTIMDLEKLGKKAFFIPTPGQFEQEYLAKKLQKEGVAPFCNQENFRVEYLKEINTYQGFSTTENPCDWKKLFQLFEK